MTEKISGSPEPVDGKCGGLLKKSIERYGEKRYCTRPAGWKTSHQGIGCCALHGGATETHIVAAARIQVAQELEEARRTLSQRLGRAPTMRDPAIELLELASEALEWRNYLRESLDDIQGQITTFDRQGVERARALIDKYQETLALCKDFLVSIQRLDLGRRRQELEEAQAELLANAMLAVIFAPQLSLTDAQVDTARELLAQSLRDLAPAWRRTLPELPVIDVEEILD